MQSDMANTEISLETKGIILRTAKDDASHLIETVIGHINTESLALLELKKRLLKMEKFFLSDSQRIDIGKAITKKETGIDIYDGILANARKRNTFVRAMSFYTISGIESEKNHLLRTINSDRIKLEYDENYMQSKKEYDLQVKKVESLKTYAHHIRIAEIDINAALDLGITRINIDAFLPKNIGDEIDNVIKIGMSVWNCMLTVRTQKLMAINSHSNVTSIEDYLAVDRKVA